jgi:DNA-binding SARP family transcriptional activator
VDVRILGSSEIRHDGSPLTLRGAKPRQLLVLLALRANHPVPTDQLIDELWEGDPPSSAAAALRVHFARLRRVLEPDRSPNTPSVRLPAGRSGYLLRLEPNELDTERFERRIMAARQAKSDGDPESAIPHLTEALDLWRGPALSDARDLSAVRSETARLDELHGEAYEALAETRLMLGEHPLVIDMLLGAVVEFPLREKLTASLMVALYRSGRAPEALRAYADLATRLDEQLGVVPSIALRRTEEQILLQHPALDVVDPGVTAPIRMHPPSIRMVGRHGELRGLIAGARETSEGRPRLLLIAGPAGIGKTMLVNEFSQRMERETRRIHKGECMAHPSEPYEPIAQVLRQLGDSRLHRTHSADPSGKPAPRPTPFPL